MKRCLTPEKMEMLEKSVEKKEIVQAMFGMKNKRAPGPDGFTATFYKQNGDVVGLVLCRVQEKRILS